MGSKTIPKKKKCKNAKWLSEEALLIAVKRRDVKSKGERERCPTEWRVPENSKEREKKKAFLKEQCKEIEENNRMGKSRDLFKKTGDIKGTLHIRMDIIQHRNGKDPTEAGEFKKRWH